MINPEERKTTAMLFAKAHTRGPIAARLPPSNMVNLGPILSQTKLVTGPDEKNAVKLCFQGFTPNIEQTYTFRKCENEGKDITKNQKA